MSLADEYNQIDESESVSNQRKILNDFINKNGNNGVDSREFIDDGCSGTNFNRPGWLDLMNKVENGKIKVIITKNLSRLGRSNFECSYYIDYFFPNKNIRYIAIQEQIDTFNNENSNNEYAALNNFINEKYSRDLSKNIKKVYKIKQYAGEYMSSQPLYGYKKDPNNKHKLIVDECAAQVVRRIFKMYLQNHSQNQIRSTLSKEKIPIPEVYKKTKRGLKVKFPYEWNYRTIRNILRNEMYIGNMVQNVFTKKSFRDKKLTKNKKNDWIIVENTHEPIVDKSIFYQTQEILNANYRHHSKLMYNFSGLLYCSECGHKIGIGNKNSKYIYTYCNYYRKNSIYNKCTPHSINYNLLENKLLEIIKNMCKKTINFLDYKSLINENKSKLNLCNNSIKAKIYKLKIQIKEIDLKLEKAYMDRLNDIITKEVYKKISAKLELDKQILIKEIEILEKNRLNNANLNKLDVTKIVSEYFKDREDKKRNLLIKIIDKIEIHQDKTIDLYFKLKQNS